MIVCMYVVLFIYFLPFFYDILEPGSLKLKDTNTYLFLNQVTYVFSLGNPDAYIFIKQL